MNPQQPANEQDFGTPLDLETMLDFAEIEIADIESAILWFDENASPEWIGALDAPPYEELT